MRIRPPLENFLLTVCSLLIFFLSLEIVFAVNDYRSKGYPLVYYETENSALWLWCYDTRLTSTPDWDLRRGSPYQLKYLENNNGDPSLQNLPPSEVPLAIEVGRNEQGFRERSFSSIEKDAEVTLVIGDSVGFGQGVRERDRFSNLLEQRMNSAGGRPLRRIINLCQPGAGIKEIQDNLKIGLDSFPRVKRIIYAYTLNDPLADNELQEKQKFIFDMMHLREEHLKKAYPILARIDSHFLGWMLKRWFLYRITRETETWYRALHRNDSTWRETVQRLSSMKESAAGRGAEFDLVIFPLFHNLRNYPFTDLHKQTTEAGRDAGMKVVDLLDIFQGTDEKILWVHPTDFHPNTEAHQKTADHLFERIKA